MGNKQFFKTYLHGCVAALTGFLLLALACVSCYLQANQYDQTAAERWRGSEGGRWLQYTVFFPAESRPASRDVESAIARIRESIAQELPAVQSGSTETFAWSGEGRLTASMGYNSAQLHAVGVGGDYFFFHPRMLLTGSYLRADETERVVVLDENAAWRLFGSIEIIGLQLDVDGFFATIIGVVEASDHQDAVDSSETAGTIYLPMSFTEKIKEMPVTNMDAVMPDVLPGYSAALLARVFPDAAQTIVENSDRFSVKRIISRMVSMEELIWQDTSVTYTQAENRARVTEHCLARLLEWMLLLSAGLAIDGLLFLRRSAITDKIASTIKRGISLSHWRGVLQTWHRSH